MTLYERGREVDFILLNRAVERLKKSFEVWKAFNFFSLC